MDTKKKNNDDLKDDLKKIAYYTTIPFQMAAIIGLGAWGGIELDKLLNTQPLLSVLLTVLSVILAIYYAVKDILKFKK